jgi:uncharacterized protein (DUF427 family)
MVRAEWNGAIIAESHQTVVIEGNHYFPRAAVRAEYLAPSKTRTTCPWKGTAGYHSLVVNGETNVDSAWYYPDPLSAASEITDRIALWRGVSIVSS